MALDFSPLQTIDPAGAFIQGQERAAERADRNALRQMQAEQMAMQRENMLAQRVEREALAAQRRAQTAKEMESQQWLGKMSALFESNNMPLNLQTARQGLSYAIQSGDKNAIEMMNKTVATLEETERDKAEMARITGGAGAAPAAARASAAPMVAPARAAGAPNELLFGTPFATGMNALAAPPAAPAAPAAPAEPMAGGFTRSQIGEMLASESKSVRERGERLSKLLPKEAEPTAGMREYQEAVRQGFKGTFMEYKQSLVPKPPQVSVKLPEQEKAFETGLGKAQAERIMEDQKVAQDARSIIDTVQQGRQLLRSGAITGFGAEALTQIGAALNQIGINFAEDAVANTQAFASNMAQNVGRIIKQFGAGTGLSNADREYAEKMAGGKITLDRKAIERILDINERAARNVIVSHNKRVQGVKTNVPLTVEMPSGPPAPAPIPGAPAAAAPAAAPAAARQVRRTGTLNGRRVIEYTDGSVEYAN